MSKRYEPAFGGNPRQLCVPAGEKSLWADVITTAAIPADGTAGYEPACMLQDKQAGVFYVNGGTSNSSCDFNAVVASNQAIADLTFRTSTDFKFKFGSSIGLKLDDAAVTAYDSAANTTASSVFLATGKGGAATDDTGLDGGSLVITTGAGSAAVESSNSNGGNGGNFVITTGAGGAGGGAGIAGASGFILLSSAFGSGGVFRKQAAPTAETNTTQTYAAAELLGGIITSTQTGAVTATLETGANLDTALNVSELGTDVGFDWTLINLGSSSGAVTVQGATGHTIVGNAVVAITTSATFRSRRTAANTWITYRLNG